MKSTISPYCLFGMHGQGLPAARLTCVAYIDGQKRSNSSFWKDRIIVASTCRRSVQFGCYVTWVRMANCFYAMARMQDLYKFTISHRCNGAWKTSRSACAHTGSRYSLVESTLFGDSASSRIRFLPVQAQPTAARSSRRAVAHGRHIGRYFYLIMLPLLIILLSLKSNFIIL